MVWSKKPSDNELGKYLPDADAQQHLQTEPIQAKNKSSAVAKCNEIAAEYGGVDPEVEKISDNQYDCRFKLWC